MPRFGSLQDPLSTRLTRVYDAGTYIVAVEGFIGGAGRYELSMECGVEDIPPLGSGGNDTDGYNGLIECTIAFAIDLSHPSVTRFHQCRLRTDTPLGLYHAARNFVLMGVPSTLLCPNSWGAPGGHNVSGSTRNGVPRPGPEFAPLRCCPVGLSACAV